MIKNKKGQMEIFWLFLAFIVILVLGFVGAILLGFVNYTSGVIAPVARDLGMVDNVNVSQAGEFTFGTLDTLLNLLPMLVGVGYLIFLVGCIALVVTYRTTANPIFMGLYLIFMILLILLSILISNAYQDIYSMNDVIGLELQSYTLLSFLILRSPFIFALVGFITGIFLFSGRQNETYGQGGY